MFLFPRLRLTLLALCLLAASAGCFAPVSPPPREAPEEGTGPGRRQQSLGLTPEQELALGRQAYREILSQSDVLPDDDRRVERVRNVGERIAQAATIRPLQREINLHLQGYEFEWEFNVLRDNKINAFCLPGGKVAVYTELLRVVQNDDQLATVMGHEIAHALAHHASERLARQNHLELARTAATRGLNSLDDAERKRMVLTLAFPGSLQGLAHDRFQESEADHIGLFLMTFAGYDPRQTVVFWEHMSAISAQRGSLPEILSDHPSDARRLAQLRSWIPFALGAKKAYDEGKVSDAR